ncbi:MAG: DUF3047 domain-containing protein [Elusimicrobia bacterium]|nr:DUF3047 domain-containing protein [Elusimicrobiota bacterium]
MSGLLLLPMTPRLTAAGFPEGWAPLVFRKAGRATAYAWDAAEHAVRARAEASASGLVRRLPAGTSARGVLRWRWKAAAALAPHDERAKTGDDFVARVYVTFRYNPSVATLATRARYALAKALYGEYPPAAGIAYVWSSREPKGASWRNPFAPEVRMLVLRTGAADAGRWVEEARDLSADYRRLFRGNPPPVAGVALMTDTDQTGASAEAWYADMSLNPR